LSQERVSAQTPKVELARRRILSIRAAAQVEMFPCRWQQCSRPEESAPARFLRPSGRN
jgi:hypothetical protein